VSEDILGVGGRRWSVNRDASLNWSYVSNGSFVQPPFSAPSVQLAHFSSVI
jgi:hypothetical protein